MENREPLSRTLETMRKNHKSLTGKTVTWHHVKLGKVFVEFMAIDGEVTSVKMMGGKLIDLLSALTPDWEQQLIKNRL